MSDEINWREVAEMLLEEIDRHAWSAGLGWWFQHCPKCNEHANKYASKVCIRHHARQLLEPAP